MLVKIYFSLILQALADITIDGGEEEPPELYPSHFSSTILSLRGHKIALC
jgi:hypothetical protein